MDASGLSINLYMMAFPFNMDIEGYSNLSGTLDFKGINQDYLFRSADYWLINFNQPVQSVSYVTLEDENGDTVTPTYVLQDGNFLNSQLKITPYTDFETKQIKIKVKDYTDKEHIFNLIPTVFEHYGEYPEYFSDSSKSLEIYVPASYYRYSFDGGTTWKDWAAVATGDLITLDFSGQSDGELTVTVEYRVGSSDIFETVSIYYLSAEISGRVYWLGNTAKVAYSDPIPLDRVEIYYNDVLSETTQPTIIDGMDSCTLDGTSLDIPVGSIYYKGEKYDYAGTGVDLSGINIADYDNYTLYRVVFGFDKVERIFKAYLLADKNFAKTTLDSIPDFLSIWLASISLRVDTGDLTYSVTLNRSEYLFEEDIISLSFGSSKDIEIKLIDVSGRELSFEANHTQISYNVWRTLTVTDPSTGETIYPGQIHQNETLNVDYSSDDWTSPDEIEP
jgi:hypothetical protein